MKVSASVYSNTEKPLENLVKELDRYRVDFFHMDCNDDLSVFRDIERIRRISKTPVDLHIISPHPEKFFDGIIRTQTELVSFQYENLKFPLSGIKPPLDIPPELKSHLGLAIVSETSPEVFNSFSDHFDFVLFMTTTPGKSGGKFNKENFQRIREFRSLFPGTKIHVDGGVNDEVSFVLRNMGVSLVVSGSFLVNSDFIGAAIHGLRSDLTESHILISDFMIGLEGSPVLVKGQFSFLDVLKSIEKYQMGFTIITNEEGKLEGIITNADVRKGLLKMEDKKNGFIDLNKLSPDNLINNNPAIIYQSNSVAEMLQKIKTLNFPILFMPVVNSSNQLTGTVTFNNLIKGES